MVFGPGLSSLLGLSTTSRVSATLPAQALATSAAEAILYDSVLPATNEGRAQFGNIFLGTVIAVSGQETIPTSDPEDILRVILYQVQVDQTLQGDAAGQVQVWYEGADYRGPDTAGPGYRHSGELRIGNRYLFFAGFNPETGEYPVNATIGVLPVKNDRHAANLVATFEPVIRDAERKAAAQARQAQGIDPCEHPTAPPSITVEPGRGTVGDAVRITGGPFIRPEAPVWWDGRRVLLAAAPIATDCTTDTVVRIPPAEPGTYRISIQDAGGNEARARFEVVRE
jgi:hypothetical protein